MEHATIQEISDQPAAITAMLETMHEHEAALRDIVSPSTQFCITGCGTSYYLSMSGNALLNRVAESVAVPGSEALISAGTVVPDTVDVVIAVSRSGESTETVRAAKRLSGRHPNATTIGLTCTPGSDIDEWADLTLLSSEGAEDSVVMTKSYSSMLTAFQYLARVVQTESAVAGEFGGLADASEALLPVAERVGEELGEQTELEKSFFLGTGEYYGLAAEAMLKFEEMTLSWVKAYHTLEFRHGPQSIADENTLVTVFLPGRRMDLHADLLDDVNDLDATTLAIGMQDDLDAVTANYTVPVPADHRDRLALYAPAFQYLAYYRAIALDLNPDEPQNLSQVIRL